MDLGLEGVAERWRKNSQEITRLVAECGAELSAASHVANNDATGLELEIARLKDDLEKERKLREASDRNRERFRYALWVYLQERDGTTGATAPTPETLKLIRDLIQELE